MCSGHSTWNIDWLNYLIENHDLNNICLPRSLKTENGHGFRDPLIFVRNNNKITLDVSPDVNSLIKNCNKDIIILNLSVLNYEKDLEIGGHANLLIINTKNHEFYRFEPNGSNDKGIIFWNWVDDYLKDKSFKKTLPSLKNYHFIETNSFCPNIGPQHIEVSYAFNGCKWYKEAHGFCIIHSLIAAHLIMMLPKEKMETIYLLLNNLGPKKLYLLVSHYLGWMYEIMQVD